MNAINVYELGTNEEQLDYFNNISPQITVFSEFDNTHGEKLIKLKNSMQKYFSFSDRFLSILNTDSKKELNKLLSFQAKVSKNNFDKEKFDIEKLRNLLKIAKKYLSFFSFYFNQSEFFMGGFKLNVNNIKEFMLGKINEIKELIYKHIIENNIFLSKKIEKDMEEISKKLDEEPESVDDYENLVNYCEKLNINIKKIWDR